VYYAFTYECMKFYHRQISTHTGESKYIYLQYAVKAVELNCLLSGTSARKTLHSSAAFSVHSSGK